jgi:hypothetical protein
LAKDVCTLLRESLMSAASWREVGSIMAGRFGIMSGSRRHDVGKSAASCREVGGIMSRGVRHHVERRATWETRGKWACFSFHVGTLSASWRDAFDIMAGRFRHHVGESAASCQGVGGIVSGSRRLKRFRWYHILIVIWEKAVNYQNIQSFDGFAS